MDIGEAVNEGVANVKVLGVSCGHQEKQEKYGWKARVNGLGEDTTKCSGTNLFEEKPHGMWARRGEHCEKKSLGFVPEKQPNSHWADKGLDAVGPESFPLQAHHLIPKNFLPKHSVCVWLCKKDTRDDDYQLSEDTFYNTDHANNGYAMPDALRLKEWKEARDDDAKTHVAFRVMELTHVQLHQGSHSGALDIAKVNKHLDDNKLLPVTPVSGSGDSDELEESEIHTPGYLDPIEEWLNAVFARVLTHVETCTEGCRGGEKGGKTEVRPLADAVRLMNQVSYIAKVFLTMHIIFVCPYGAAYAVQKEFLVWDNDRKQYRVRKRAKTGLRDLTKDDLRQALRRP